jgi:RNA polymerase sigma factor (sigma-70 family)
MAGEAARGPTLHGAALRGAVIERIMARVLASFRRLVRDPAAAEDCAQRTLIALERSLREGKYDPSRSFNAWIWVKAHSVFVDWCRERGRRMEPLPEEEAAAPAPASGGRRDGPPARAAEGPAGVERRLDAEALLKAVEERLGAEAAACFVLRYEGDLSLEEVAEAVGRDRRTVAKRIEAAHALMDRLLGKERGEGKEARRG